MYYKRTWELIRHTFYYFLLMGFFAWFGTFVVLSSYWALHVVAPNIAPQSVRDLIRVWWPYGLAVPGVSALYFAWFHWKDSRDTKKREESAGSVPLDA